jgi:hypothetical protein
MAWPDKVGIGVACLIGPLANIGRAITSVLSRSDI